MQIELDDEVLILENYCEAEFSCNGKKEIVQDSRGEKIVYPDGYVPSPAKVKVVKERFYKIVKEDEIAYKLKK